MQRRRWNELSPWRKTAVLVLAPIELTLTAVAAADLVRRPAEQVRGRKAAWWPAIFVQPAGPILYLWWGRHARS